VKVTTCPIYSLVEKKDPQMHFLSLSMAKYTDFRSYSAFK